MDVTIVGGGIAGPATALALAAVGIRSTILEAGAGEDGSGSWLGLAPNGLAGLAELDVLDRIRPLGVPSPLTVLQSGTGAPLGEVALGAPIEDGTAAMSFRRSDLAAALRSAAIRRGAHVRTGARVVSAEPSGTVVLEGGERLGADLVVGADGIRSVVRTAIDPKAPAPRYVGLVNFGGITRDTDLGRGLRPHAWTMVFGSGAFFGALPIGARDVVWFVNVPRPAVTRDERRATDAGQWRDRLAAIAAPDAGAMAELIRSGELELAADNTHDLPRVPCWHRGRLVAIGDAVHAPSPSSGQGASMAIEDAIALARCLRDAADTTDPAPAFAVFEAARRARVERIVRDGARSTSLKTPHGLGRAFRDAIMPWVFRHVVTERSQSWKYDHRERLR